jgi:hypothetical protein
MSNLRITDRTRGDGKLILDRLSTLEDHSENTRVEIIELLLEAGALATRMPDAEDFLVEVRAVAIESMQRYVESTW